MEAIVIVLNDLNYLDEILEVFIKFQVDGATILDSYGMGKALRESKNQAILMKGSIDKAVPQENSSSKTIFSIIPKEKSDLIIKTVRYLLNRSENNVVGIVFSMPINQMHYIK